MKTVEFTEYSLTYDDSQEAKERIFNLALEWFKKHEMYRGEVLGQSDTTYIEGPELLYDLAEKGFQFSEEWKE